MSSLFKTLYVIKAGTPMKIFLTDANGEIIALQLVREIKFPKAPGYLNWCVLTECAHISGTRIEFTPLRPRYTFTN